MLFSNAARLFTILSTSGVAASVTVGMLIFNRNDKPLVQEENQIFENIEIKAEDFQKQEYYYSKDGTNDGKMVQATKEQWEQIQQVLRGERDLDPSKESSGAAGEPQPIGDQNDRELTENDEIPIPKVPVQQQVSKDGEKSGIREIDKSFSVGDKDKQEDSENGDSVTNDDGPKDQSDVEGENGKQSNLDLNVATSEDTGEVVSNPDEAKKEDIDSSSKTAEISGGQDSVDQPLSTSSEEGGGEGDSEDCEPCPNGKKKSQELSDEKNKELDKEGASDLEEIPPTGSKDSNKGEENGDVSLQKNNDNVPKSVSNEDTDSDGVLNEETGDSLLTNKEQLSVLEDLYGQVTDVLFQLNSRFNI